MKAAAQTVITVKSKCEGWFQFSRETLVPAIEQRNQPLHSLRTAEGLPENIVNDIKEEAKKVQLYIDNMTALAK